MVKNQSESVFLKKIQPANKTTITLGDAIEHESCINGACAVGLE